MSGLGGSGGQHSVVKHHRVCRGGPPLQLQVVRLVPPATVQRRGAVQTDPFLIKLKHTNAINLMTPNQTKRQTNNSISKLSGWAPILSVLLPDASSCLSCFLMMSFVSLLSDFWWSQIFFLVSDDVKYYEVWFCVNFLTKANIVLVFWWIQILFLALVCASAIPRNHLHP